MHTKTALRSKRKSHESGILKGLDGTVDFLRDRLRISKAIAGIKTTNRYDKGLHDGGVLAIEHAIIALRRDIRAAKSQLSR